MCVVQGLSRQTRAMSKLQCVHLQCWAMTAGCAPQRSAADAAAETAAKAEGKLLLVALSHALMLAGCQTEASHVCC